MFRFLSRVIAVLLLCVAVVLAVLDATRSVAANELVLTPLGTSWFTVSPGTLNLAQALVQRYTLPQIWDPGMIWVLSMPGFAVIAVLALLFYLMGSKRRRRSVIA
jgi:hypothetical protein